MKPPPRKRLRPSKELPEAPVKARPRAPWPRQELRRLLTALSRLSPEDRLDPERLRLQLPSHTPAQINLFLEALKEKVIVFAKTKERAERREDQRSRKPLEMWIREASAVSGGVEETLSSAFTQMLTVTSIEPYAPPPPQTLTQPLSRASSASPLVCPSPSVGETPTVQPASERKKSSQTPIGSPLPVRRTSPSPRSPLPLRRTSPSPGSPLSMRKTLLSTSKMSEVSFERIYHYLSTLHKPTEQRKLTPMESAVVLDLLMSLPEQLLLLDCDPLRQHLSQAYLNLSTQPDCRTTQDCPKAVKRKTSVGVSDPQQTHPAPEDRSTQKSTPNPPLNPFRVPVRLLSQNAPKSPP